MLVTSNPAPGAFDPACAGTHEHLWHVALEGARTLILPEADLLVVSPHPDDETLGAGGLMRTAMQRAHKVTVLSVTDGEAAFSDWPALRRVRHRELKHAMRVLSPRPIAHKRLRIPDGRVAASQTALYDAVNALASPTTLLVAPYESDGHPDHEATGAVCTALARERGLRLWRYPIWAWHQRAPGMLAGAQWGRFWLAPETQRSKAMAMDCFTSQMHPEDRAPIVPPHVVSYFTRPYEAFLL